MGSSFASWLCGPVLRCALALQGIALIWRLYVEWGARLMAYIVAHGLVGYGLMVLNLGDTSRHR